MDPPLCVLWAEHPDATFRIDGWTGGTDHEHVTVRVVEAAADSELAPGDFCSAPLSELRMDDAKAPNLFEALARLRDFKHYALTRTRRPGGVTWHADGGGGDEHNAILEMLLDLDGLEGARPAPPGPKEARILKKWKRRQGVASLADVPEPDRDAKTCAIWVERDVLEYAHVPERHRTDDALGARYRAAKRKKQAAEASEVAEAAAAEAKRAKRREADRARRARKKAEAEAEAAQAEPTTTAAGDEGVEVAASNPLDSSDDEPAPTPPSKPKPAKPRSAVDAEDTSKV